MISGTRILPAACVLAFVALASGCDGQAPAAAAPARPFLVVANQRSGVATLVGLANGRVSHVALGAKPHEVAISPDARIAALTVPTGMIGSSRKVIVLDLITATIRRTIDLRTYDGPHGITFLSDSVALVGTLDGTSVVYVDISNGKVLRAIDGLPPNPYIVKRVASGRAYVSSPMSSKVTEIDVAAGRATRTIAIPDDPAGIAVTADGKELYAALSRDDDRNGIAIYNLERGVVSAIIPATRPRRLTITADGRSVVVSDRDHLRIVDRATHRVRSIAIGANAGGSGVDCSPDSRRCYVALSQAGEIVEVDLASEQVTRRFAAQPGVDGLAYVPR